MAIMTKTPAAPQPVARPIPKFTLPTKQVQPTTAPATRPVPTFDIGQPGYPTSPSKVASPQPTAVGRATPEGPGGMAATTKLQPSQPVVPRPMTPEGPGGMQPPAKLLSPTLPVTPRPIAPFVYTPPVAKIATQPVQPRGATGGNMLDSLLSAGSVSDEMAPALQGLQSAGLGGSPLAQYSQLQRKAKPEAAASLAGLRGLTY